ncbi:cob(I)yrinic acid a,c-diamide adenosyltransferase [Desulfosporosinus nitroreducens]|uniref:cob(I)yrinic acid a,c-diamide adenosyltransferase n=1 Tax=Desulfosporosinus nitroreducens TaxID=2018668 RepID=UPI00207C30B3|nr:cob(I)yrinic acid a,c-diamide adenosyltransferase [Desulfosporosinus nitroreducens]MCO1600564.1 cob(I)yrinic acid a,c-diamide adenosyltransferase [Desulfosporosinus nitroreducens]
MSGLTLVYTGNGKGKTTASLGLSMRALGHNQNVGFLQFMKGSKDYGEVKFATMLRNFTLVQSGQESFVSYKFPDPIDIKMAQEGLELARKWFEEDTFDLVVLDELLVAVAFKLVSVAQVIDLVKQKPPRLNLVMTGRYAAPEIIEIADTVTEMTELRHAYQRGVQAKEGMEF